jgi:hypothetical protein
MRRNSTVLEALEAIYRETPKRRPAGLFNDDDGLNSSAVSRELEDGAYSLRDLGPRDLTLELVDKVIRANGYGRSIDPKAARYVAGRTLELCVLRNDPRQHHELERRLRFLNAARWKGDRDFREALQRFFVAVLGEVIELEPELQKARLGTIELLQCTVWAGCQTAPVFSAWESSTLPNSANRLAEVLLDHHDAVSSSPDWTLQQDGQNWFRSDAAGALLDRHLRQSSERSDAVRWQRAREVLSALHT